MGLFEKLFGSQDSKKMEQTRRAAETFKLLNAYAPVFTSWRGSIYESEMVRAAIHSLAAHASKMNVSIRGSAKPSLQTKLRNAPNDFQTWSQFLYRLMTILQVENNAFIVPVIDRYDDTTGIALVLPRKTEFVEYKGVPYLRYEFADGKRAAIELSRCGIMTRFQYRSDFLGENNHALSDTMDLLHIQSQGIKEGIKNGASYRFMARITNYTFDEDLAAERKRFSTANLSADADGGGLLLFPNTYDNIQQINNTPYVVSADQMKLINDSVSNYFGVSEKILQNMATASELDSFYNGALEPFAIQLSEVLTKMLFTQNEQSRGSVVHVASDRLQYMSAQNKVNVIATLGDRGMITINEARALLNYPPIEGGDEMLPIRGEYYSAVNGLNEKEGEENADQE